MQAPQSHLITHPAAPLFNQVIADHKAQPFPESLNRLAFLGWQHDEEGEAESLTQRAFRRIFLGQRGHK